MENIQNKLKQFVLALKKCPKKGSVQLSTGLWFIITILTCMLLGDWDWVTYIVVTYPVILLCVILGLKVNQEWTFQGDLIMEHILNKLNKIIAFSNDHSINKALKYSALLWFVINILSCISAGEWGWTLYIIRSFAVCFIIIFAYFKVHQGEEN